MKNLPVIQETRFNSWVGKNPWRRDRLHTPVILGLPWLLRWQRIYVHCRRLGLGRSPGGGHGKPLQYSWWGFSDISVGNESACNAGDCGSISWRRERLPTPVLWPGEFHGLYSPWGPKDLDMTVTFTFTCLRGFLQVPNHIIKVNLLIWCWVIWSL